jgi:hypothetical protein
MFYKLQEVIDLVGENRINEVLATFDCCRNTEVQEFLRTKAVSMEKSHNAATYLDIISNADNTYSIKGYFTIALQVLNITYDIPNKDRRIITAGKIKRENIAGYLIGQIAKCNGVAKGYGKFLVNTAIEIIKIANSLVSGRILYLDCKDVLVNYYIEQGFKFLRKDAEDIYNQLYMII